MVCQLKGLVERVAAREASKMSLLPTSTFLKVSHAPEWTAAERRAITTWLESNRSRSPRIPSPPVIDLPFEQLLEAKTAGMELNARDMARLQTLAFRRVTWEEQEDKRREGMARSAALAAINSSHPALYSPIFTGDHVGPSSFSEILKRTMPGEDGKMTGLSTAVKKNAVLNRCNKMVILREIDCKLMDLEHARLYFRAVFPQLVEEGRMPRTVQHLRKHIVELFSKRCHEAVLPEFHIKSDKLDEMGKLSTVVSALEERKSKMLRLLESQMGITVPPDKLRSPSTFWEVVADCMECSDHDTLDESDEHEREKGKSARYWAQLWRCHLMRQFINDK